MDSRVKLEAGELSFHGISRAGLCTGVAVSPLSLMFDAGACFLDIIHVDTVLISHGHVDHFSALPQVLTMRKLLNKSELHIVVPAGCADAIKAFLREGQNAGVRSPWRYRIEAVSPGDRIELKGHRHAIAFAVDHTIPCLGYVVYETRRKLLPALLGLESKEIARRRRAGETIDSELTIPVLAVSGDTTAEGLRAHPDVARARVLLAECTFIAPEHLDRAAETKHTHLRDLAAIFPDFSNEAIVLYHVSLRYVRSEVEAALDEVLAPDLRKRVHVFL